MKFRVASFIIAGKLSLAATSLAAQDAPLVTKAGPIPAVEAGKGQIIFYRPGSMMGMALGCTVHEGDAEVARLGSGKYWVQSVAPGKHAYFTEGEAKDTLNLEIEPDETYFVKCKIGMGVMSGRANLSPSDRAEFAKKAKGMNLWKPKGD
ncbi:MAG: hypothetical protein JWN66_1093 [Sphingomonas bacterium]|uniref:DUF2846 domain-containing protein n=1 Tax=Sphingomonas bacterium TaxID=1895847 RepID=UPI00260B353C|nr:DUF2846 domain-containing protein [Sphingomonas bacterium]MDB5703977.1 hypothetical protein [Sphingomonas bacterium]